MAYACYSLGKPAKDSCISRCPGVSYEAVKLFLVRCVEWQLTTWDFHSTLLPSEIPNCCCLRMCSWNICTRTTASRAAYSFYKTGACGHLFLATKLENRISNQFWHSFELWRRFDPIKLMLPTKMCITQNQIKRNIASTWEQGKAIVSEYFFFKVVARAGQNTRSSPTRSTRIVLTFSRVELDV